MITAKIAPDKPGVKGLWLTILHNNEHDEDCAWPITEEEIPAIMIACQKYLESLADRSEYLIDKTKYKVSKG
jgi:hypothetical protein